MIQSYQYERRHNQQGKGLVGVPKGNGFLSNKDQCQKETRQAKGERNCKQYNDGSSFSTSIKYRNDKTINKGLYENFSRIKR